MANITNILKNVTSLTGTVKNTVTPSNKNNVSILAYLLTPNLNKILVGATETDTLILWGNLSVTNLIKH